MRTLFLISLFPLIILVDIFFPYHPFRFAGIRFLPVDFLYFVIVVYLVRFALLNPTRFRALLRVNVLLSLFLVTVAVCLVLSFPVYGQSAIGEARKFYGVFLFPLFALALIKTPDDLRRLMIVTIFVAACVAILGLGAAATTGTVVRALNSQAALVVGFAAFSLLVHRLYGIVVISPHCDRLLLILFSFLVFTAGQRSAWMAMGLGLVLFFFLYRTRATTVAKLGIGIAVAAFLLTIAIIVFPEMGTRISTQFSGLIDPSSDRNASWRMEGWRQQLERLVGQGNLLFGEGLGGYYYWRQDGGGAVEVSPHNAYVQMVLKLGLAGLMLYVVLVVNFFRQMLAVRKRLRPGPTRAYVEIGIITFGAVHAYMLGYDLEPVGILFFGMAITGAHLARQMTLRTGRSPQAHHRPTTSPVAMRVDRAMAARPSLSRSRPA